jgi:hypothetical protein
VTLVHESPYLISVPPRRQGDILVDLDMLILRRPACRRYIETNRSMANAPLLLQDWFPETATSTGETLVSEGLPPSEFDRPRRGRRHGQQCFPYRGSRAEIMAGQHFFLQRSFLERSSPLSASPKRGQRRRCATDIGAAAAPRRPRRRWLRCLLCTALKAGQRGAAAAHSSQKNHALAGWVVSAVHSTADQGSVGRQVSV